MIGHTAGVYVVVRDLHERTASNMHLPHSPVILLTTRLPMHLEQRRAPVLASCMHWPSIQPSGLHNSK